MKFSKYLKDKYIYILILMLNFIISFELMINIDINTYCAIFIELLFLGDIFLIFLIDYLKKRSYYKKFSEAFLNLEEKSYISEMISKPDFIEGEILYNALKVEGKYINDIILDNDNQFKEYQRYIETWVHEIKTPIATAKLLIENNKNITTLSIDEEINKIDNYIEQVLYVAKSDSIEKDYIIKELYLKEIVMNVVKKKSKEIINKKIKLIIHDLDFYILSDQKWVEFIISQLIGNAIKYTKSNPELEFYGSVKEGKITLFIKDNGIGIPSEDISKVFERGFTGNNGRAFAQSTGMGLYLCKKLCDKLNVDINIDSKVNEYTILKLTFLESGNQKNNVIRDKELLFSKL